MVKTLLPVTVIIPTLNRPQTLIKTLSSIQTKTYIPNEIIIIDQSDSNLINQDFLSLMKINLKIKIIYLSEKSIAKARNVGIRASINEIIAFSDDDIDFFNEVFYLIYINFLNDKKLNLIASYDKDHRFRLSSILGILTFRKSLFKIFFGHVTKSVLGNFPILKIKAKTEWAMGFFFCIKKSICFNHNIFFDDYFSSYSFSEDLDFTYRYIKNLQKYKLKAILLPDLVLKHLVSTEYRVKSVDFYYMYLNNRYYLINKLFHSSIIYKIHFSLSNFFFSLFLYVKSKNSYNNYLIAKKRFMTNKRYS